MTARHYYRFDPEEDTEEVPNVLRWGYQIAGKAEEGQAGAYEIVVDDPDSTMDFVGHRRWTVYEDESDDGNEIVVDGMTQAVRIAHKGGDITQPHGRVHTIEVADLNTLWGYRVMTGSDSQFPAQTDVERMQQLIDSEEFSYVDDVTLLSTAEPVDMDKLNGRGQYAGQIAEQCAQASGKNWYLSSNGTRGEVGADIFVWYGKDSLPAYVSELSLSNDPADLDMAAVNAGTATTYPIGSDTVLRRDYARQYSGAYGEFQGGAKYVVDAATLAAITLSGRDTTHPAPEIKSRAQMSARLGRVLRDHRGPDEVISTTITLPASKVTQARAGMAISFKATHEPGYEAPVLMRIMSATPKPIGNLYEVALELQGPGEPEEPPEAPPDYPVLSLSGAGDCVADKFGGTKCPVHSFAAELGTDGVVSTYTGRASFGFWPLTSFEFTYYFTMDMGSSTEITSMQWLPANDSGRIGVSKVHSLEGSDDGVSWDDLLPVTTLDTLSTEDSFWDYVSTRVVVRATFSAGQTYRYFRLGSTRTGGAGPQTVAGITFAEWHLE